MKLFNIFSALAISFAALISFNASAQTTVPVSCTWQISGTTSSTVYKTCYESNGTYVASQEITSIPNQTAQCSLTMSYGIQYYGSCENPSFIRVTSCQNSGKLIATACYNSLTTQAFSTYTLQQCGACGARQQVIGWTALCPHPGQSMSGSPETKVYCN